MFLNLYRTLILAFIRYGAILFFENSRLLEKSLDSLDYLAARISVKVIPGFSKMLIFKLTQFVSSFSSIMSSIIGRILANRYMSPYPPATKTKQFCGTSSFGLDHSGWLLPSSKILRWFSCYSLARRLPPGSTSEESSFCHRSNTYGTHSNRTRHSSSSKN